MTNEKKVAIVTGANRGIGFEIAKQLAKKGITVVLTGRDEKKAEDAAQSLVDDGLDVVAHQLDVTDEKSIQALKTSAEKKFNRIDILINNAGVFLDKQTPDIFKTPLEMVHKTIETNTLGPLRMCQVFIPIMNDGGRVVNVSSSMGQLEGMDGDYAAYRISKTALNAVTKLFSTEVKGRGILVNSAHPGWVRTRMGGQDAPKTPEAGADTIVWLATADIKTTGGFFSEREQIGW